MILHNTGLFYNCIVTDNRPQGLRDIIGKLNETYRREVEV